MLRRAASEEAASLKQLEEVDSLKQLASEEAASLKKLLRATSEEADSLRRFQSGL